MEFSFKEHTYQKGRGAQINTQNPFNQVLNEQRSGNPANRNKTSFQEVYPKTILNKVTSEDIAMEWSINPYQGCEHGCVYCYARNTHPYWGYSAGKDFEKQILFKRNAPHLLRKKLESKSWKASPIMISGNTDCYQPVEQKLKITRKLLEVLWEFRHPAGIITKNQLILRDKELLAEMASSDLIRVAISINTLDEKIRAKLEPRTATIKQRFKVVEILSSLGIPVTVMIAPVIPGLTDHEIFNVIERSAKAGANAVKYIIVRLNGDVEAIFSDWLSKTHRDRKAKIMNQIASCHGGQVNDSRIGKRMHGEGKVAKVIKDQFELANKKFFGDSDIPPMNTHLYEMYRDRQLSLFT